MLGKLFKGKKKGDKAQGADTPEKGNDEEKVKPKLSAAEGEDGGAGTEGPEAGPKKSKRKRLLLLGVVIVLLLAIAGGVYVLMTRSQHAADMPSDASAPGSQSAVGGEGTAYYTLPEFLVNLNTASKQASFLKMTVILQLKSQEDVKKIEVVLPRVLDNMNTYLREMRATDLSGSAGVYRLREELLVRVNKTVAPVKIDDILFKEIIVQ